MIAERSGLGRRGIAGALVGACVGDALVASARRAAPYATFTELERSTTALDATTASAIMLVLVDGWCLDPNLENTGGFRRRIEHARSMAEDTGATPPIGTALVAAGLGPAMAGRVSTLIAPLVGDEETIALEACAVVAALDAGPLASIDLREWPADRREQAHRLAVEIGSRKDVLPPMNPVERLMLAVACALAHPSSFRQAIRAAVAIGQPRLGALVGAVAGAHAGVAGIPRSWVRRCSAASAAIETADALALRSS